MHGFMRFLTYVLGFVALYLLFVIGYYIKEDEVGVVLPFIFSSIAWFFAGNNISKGLSFALLNGVSYTKKIEHGKKLLEIREQALEERIKQIASRLDTANALA